MTAVLAHARAAGLVSLDSAIAYGDGQHLGEIGVEEPTELDALWPIFPLDLIQAPFNVVDRRLATSGWLARLHDFECEVHIRSVF